MPGSNHGNLTVSLVLVGLGAVGLGPVASAMPQVGDPQLRQTITTNWHPNAGRAIALAGDTLVLSNSVYIEQRHIEFWKEVDGTWQLSYGYGQSASFWGDGAGGRGVSIDPAASVVAVGDPMWNHPWGGSAAWGGGNQDCGCGSAGYERVVLFRRQGDAWAETIFSGWGLLGDIGASTCRRFGWSVDAEGGIVVVGSPYYGSGEGEVCVLQERAEGWVVADRFIVCGHPGGWLPPFGFGWSVRLGRDALNGLLFATAPWFPSGTCFSSAPPAGQGGRLCIYSLNSIGDASELQSIPLSGTPTEVMQDGGRIVVLQGPGNPIAVITRSGDGQPWSLTGQIVAPADVPAEAEWGAYAACDAGRLVTVSRDNRIFVYQWDPSEGSAGAYVLRSVTTGPSGNPIVPMQVVNHPSAPGQKPIALSGATLAIQAYSGVVLVYDLFEDCDDDGVPDSEQIAEDPLLDCDLTGVLDACEPIPTPPPPPVRSTWRAPLGGSFQDPANWCRLPPVAGTSVEFGIPFTYAAQLTQSREVRNVSVSRGFPTVEFSNATQVLRSSTSFSIPTSEKFLRVGTVPGVPASLGVIGGTVSTALGEVGVGAGTEGTLLVGPGGKVVSTSELCVGCEGEGTLLLQNGGQAVSQKAVIGKGPSSVGVATVESSYPSTPSSWTATLGIDVKGGSLAVNQNGVIQAAPIGVILYSGGSLSGSGTIVGPVTNFGAAAGSCGTEGVAGAPMPSRTGGLVPGGAPPSGGHYAGGGDSIATLTVQGDYQQIAANPDLGTNSGSLLIEVAKRPEGVVHDRLVVSGTATLGGGLFVTLASDPSEEEIEFAGLPVLSAGSIDAERANFDIAFMPALPGGRFVKVDDPVALQGGGGAITISTADLGAVLGFGGASNATFDLEPLAAAVGDFDGSNGNDVAVTLKGTAGSGAGANGSLLVLFNDGEGGLQNVVQLPNQLGIDPVDVVAAPLRPGRKVPDLAVVNRGSNTLQVLYNDGIGNFTVGAVASTGAGSSPSSIDALPVFAEDPTLAGIYDLAITSPGFSSVVVFFNPGAGAPVPILALPAGAGPQAVRGVDIDNNRFFDLAVVNPASGSVSVLTRRAPGKEGGVSFNDAVSFAVGDDPIDLAIGDLDGDGLADVTTVNRLSDSVSVLLNRTSVAGEATFAPAVTLPTGGSPQSIVLGDFDADSAEGGSPDLDIALTARATAAPDAPRVIKVIRNDRTEGILVLAPADDVVVEGAPKLVVADEFDAAAGADLVSLSLGGAETLQGGPPVATASLVPSRTGARCAAADLDCDGAVGALDLAILLAAWGTSDAAADLDGSGSVDALDLAELLSNWGSAGAK